MSLLHAVTHAFSERFATVSSITLVPAHITSSTCRQSPFLAYFMPLQEVLFIIYPRLS